MSGVVNTGFQLKTLAEIKTEIEDDLRTSFGPSIDVSATSVLGNLVGVLANGIAELWEVAQGVYSSQYPSTASGASLDQVASISGAERLPATPTIISSVELNGTLGTVVPAGSVITSPVAGDRFYLEYNHIIGDPNPRFVSEQLGPIPAPGHTAWNIATPVAGWTSVFYDYDVSDGDPNNPRIGADEETDAAFRLRRLQLLARSGDATLDAIRSDVLSVLGVNAVSVFENVTMTTDADGIPPKSIEVVVDDGNLVANTDIAQAIFESKAAGIRAHGNTSGIAQDAQGFTHTIGFSRPAFFNPQVDVYVEVVSSQFPADGVAQIQENIKIAANSLNMGQDIFKTRLFAPVYRVPGVQNVSNIILAGADVNGNVVVGPRAKAVVITVIVHVTTVSPT